MIIRGEIIVFLCYYCIILLKVVIGCLSNCFWKIPHFFKDGGTLSPILKFFGRTLVGPDLRPICLQRLSVFFYCFLFNLTAMVMPRRSVDLTTLFPGQA